MRPPSPVSLALVETVLGGAGWERGAAGLVGTAKTIAGRARRMTEVVVVAEWRREVGGIGTKVVVVSIDMVAG